MSRSDEELLLQHSCLLTGEDPGDGPHEFPVHFHGEARLVEEFVREGRIAARHFHDVGVGHGVAVEQETRSQFV